MRLRELVIARCCENLDWVAGIEDWKISVYDKSETEIGNSRQDSPERMTVTPLPNVGREAHTYLSHIITRYETLADVTVFVQGNPHDHVQNLDRQLHQFPKDPGFRELGHTPVVDDSIGIPSHPGLDIAGLYQSFFETKPPSYYPFHAGANFAVTRAVIRQRPREFYQRALTAVLSSKQGPWEIERLWPMIFPSRTPQPGIVTAATSDVFFDLQQLLLSLEPFDRFPVEIFDLGLTDSQKAWTQRQLRELPRLVNRVSRLQRVREWPTWLKPFYLLHSQFDQPLWIDADCIVLKDPAGAFDLIRQQPLLITDVSPVVVRNHPSLDQNLPVVDADPEVRINAGIVGLDRKRDAEMLGAWAWAVQWVARNLRLRNRFRWFDQGALLWAVQKLSRAHVVRSDLTWNTPWMTDENVAEQAAVRGHSLTEELRKIIPAAGIVHFLGKRKLSRQCRRLLNGRLGETGNLADSKQPIESNSS